LVCLFVIAVKLYFESSPLDLDNYNIFSNKYPKPSIHRLMSKYLQIIKLKTKMNTKIIVALVISTFLSACAQFNPTQISNILGQGGELSTSEIGQGLKEALKIGVENGSSQASAVDGYFKNSLIKIVFPPDAQKIENTLRQIGLGSEVDKFVLSLNRAAEDAAKKAKPIFWNAITSMTIQDALGILKGDKTAATEYLRRTTYQSLFQEFSPVVQNALGQNDATKYYSDLATAYNKIPFTSQKLNTDLQKYATDQAINGLFKLVADEEQKIRENPAARVTDLLKKVFSKQ
jgi:hypothetical protein